jgi:dienelactone hydrolase
MTRRTAWIGFALLSVASNAMAGGTLSIDGDQFTYSDAEGSAAGRIHVPGGPGPHGAIVLNHGQGGSPSGFPNFAVFAGWDVVLIAPELTHVMGGETAPATTGFTPENLSRIRAGVRALEALGEVDPARVAMFGHSKGAYATIGAVAALGAEVRVAAMTAGGVVPDMLGTSQAAPTYGESAGVVAPFLMLHGNVDGAVPPERSLDFAQRLSAAGVPNLRIEYDVSGLPPETQHNLHQDPAINADLVVQVYEWFELHGVFGAASLFSDGFEQ